ncbi:hypothetical protein [Botrimarina sp.]|uniref:hypothetical protein n=1 Tax=Botrimarina sp. TaxID=2795802 RepID=UPI0032EE4613
MRLTLRTLLSYIDNVLEEPARSELRRQIENSEHASEWVHRTRDVTRRLRLGAPPTGGTGSADDPNTVAEYLDRTLPEEGVSEFERACFESDLMLAEVASCHHVLAMFLSEPPEIDPDTRNRLHRLKDDLAEALAARAATQPQPPPDHEAPPAAATEPVPVAATASTDAADRAAPTEPAAVADRAPDYLRRREESALKRWAPALAALVVLAVTLVVALGPGGLLRDQQRVAEADTAEPAAVDPATDEAPAEPEPDEAAGAADDDAAEAEPAAGASDPSDAANAAPPGPAPTPTTPTPPADEQPITGEAGAGETGAAATGETPARAPGEQAAQPVPADTDDETEEAEPPPPAKFVGPPTALAMVETAEGRWRRLLPDAEIGQATHVVSAPTYRPVFRLTDRITAELVGQTEAILTPATGPSNDENAESEAGAEEGAPPRIRLEHGKLLLRTPQGGEEGEEPAPIDLVIDGVTYRATLGPSAVLAIEADRFFQPGELSEEAAQPLVAIAHGLSGTIGWSSKGVDLKISKPKQWYVTGESNSYTPDDFGDPSWIEALEVSPPDLFAAPAIAEAIDPAKPVWPQLMELAAEPYREVRSLAGRTSLALGHPEPLVESFRQPSESAAWRSNLDALRRAASRSTEKMAEIERVFAEKYGPAAAGDLVELLVGFSRDEVGADAEALARGAVPNVILPILESEDLASRVLASLVLEESVEPLDRPYDPLDTMRKRARALQVLSRQITEAELRPAAR